ncbi:MAG TPA: hypothetical protein VNP97_05145, partial [Microbacterium sp.]|nr:hypothetical protein [Microbacterium sp.]
MFFDANVPPDPAGVGWDAVGRGDVEWEAAAAEIPDTLGRVVEVADMMSVFAAQRFVQIDAMRREALADAERHGRTLSGVVD